MKNVKLAIAVTSALTALASNNVMADWENLPSTGMSVGSDISAYKLCNPTGNFGSGSGANADMHPTSISDPCAVLPTSSALPPDSSFTGASRIPVVSRTTPIVMNNSYTNNTNATLGTIREYVWRRSTAADTYQCIYGMQVEMSLSDYNLNTSYPDLFEINDLARKGWTGKTIDVAYSTVPTSAFSTYRIGRTFTSVKHGTDNSYVNQPPIGLGASPAITYTQKADLNSDWVDFTTRVIFGEVVGSSGDTYAVKLIAPSSGMQYIRTSCSGGPFATAADAIRLRQTSRVGQPPIEVEVEGVIPN